MNKGFKWQLQSEEVAPLALILVNTILIVATQEGDLKPETFGRIISAVRSSIYNNFEGESAKRQIELLKGLLQTAAHGIVDQSVLDMFDEEPL